MRTDDQTNAQGGKPGSFDAGPTDSAAAAALPDQPFADEPRDDLAANELEDDQAEDELDDDDDDDDGGGGGEDRDGEDGEDAEEAEDAEGEDGEYDDAEEGEDEHDEGEGDQHDDAADNDLEDGEDGEEYDDDADDDEDTAAGEGDEIVDEVEETEFATVATGADVDEAKRTALAQLRKLVPWVTEDDVEYEVVDEGARGGFFGRGRKGAEVEARVRPSAAPADAELEPLAEDLRDFLSEVVERMGLEAHVDVHEDGDAVIADLSGPDLGILIGRHGQTIDALQYVCAIAVNRSRKSRRRVVVDAEGYRDRRASSLHSMADRVAQRVVRDREPITLKPMSAAERKVIHLRLKDNPKVETSSEGQEPTRAVIIAPRSSR